MTLSRTPVIGITMGDPAGIGPEIVAKVFAEGGLHGHALVVGDAGVMRRAVSLIGSDLTVHPVRDISVARFEPETIDVLDVGGVPDDLDCGFIDARAGAASFAFVERAIADAIAGRIDAIVTAPIHKEAWRAAGVAYPGHTELLADRTEVRDFAMMLFNDELRVVLVSIHVALREAIALVTRENVLRTIRLADRAARDLGIKHPRVAVAGLNPHAGEGGQFGREDLDIIAPAVAEARAIGIDASGPWPPDTVFMQARAGKFDIVVAQYHDQGLIPVKYLGVDNGVNVTVGLPFVRTSVDHGTAFDIAGKGIADHSSLKIAIEHAVRMAMSRDDR